MGADIMRTCATAKAGKTEKVAEETHQGDTTDRDPTQTHGLTGQETPRDSNHHGCAQDREKPTDQNEGRHRGEEGEVSRKTEEKAKKN